MSDLTRQSYQLSNGASIPVIGLGTCELMGVKGERAISGALRVGYRHVDTAQMYCNEDIVGRCIQAYPRESLFITSKIGPWQYGTRGTLDAAANILRNLETDYVDMLLLHWPGVYGREHSDPEQVAIRHESYRALELLQDSGKVKNIGVANFLPRHLDKLLDECSVKPCVNQIEFHPLCFDLEILKYCTEESILVEAYCPFARNDNRLWKQEKLELVATQTGRTKAQVILRWALNRGVVVLPKNNTVSRLRDNLRLDFNLTDYQMSLLDSLQCNVRIDWNPHVISV